jgi:gluconolactonase
MSLLSSYCLSFRAASCLLGLALLTAMSALAQPGKAQTDFFAPAAKPVAVFTGGLGEACEGPAMSPEGLLYFTDTPSATSAGIIWVYNPQSHKTTVARSPSSNASGLLFDDAGDLITVEGANGGGRQLTKTNQQTGISTTLVSTFAGKPFNAPNDATLDVQGNLYFTDARYAGPEPLELPFMGVYRLAPGGTAQLLAANAAKPNGIAISPDQKTLYVASYEYPQAGVYGPLPPGFTGPAADSRGDLLAYDLLPNGQVKLRQTLQHYEGQGPDGIKVDVEGNLYAIVANCVMVYSPLGTKLAELPVPVREGYATNLCFGRGKYSKTLFITATKTLYMLETKKEGWQIPAGR